MSARIVTVGAEASALLAALHDQGLSPGWPEAEFAKIMITPGAFALVVQADRPSGMLAGWVVADEAEILSLANPSCTVKRLNRPSRNSAKPPSSVPIQRESAGSR